MRPPLIIDNHGDVLVFRSPEDAQWYLEAIDVDNDEYVGYDSQGRLLALTTLVGRVIVRAAEEEPLHRSELRDILVDHLCSFGIPRAGLELAPLEELVAKRLQYKTD